MKWVCTELFFEETRGPVRKDVKASTGRLEIGNTMRICGPVQLGLLSAVWERNS